MGSTHIWKLLHLLNTHGPKLSRAAIREAGFDCDPDTLYPLVSTKVIEALPPDRPYYEAEFYCLSGAATSILQNCLVAYRHSIYGDLKIAEAAAFVVMPFTQPWSANVYAGMIEPACKASNLLCLRGDTIPRTRDLVSNLLQAICDAGIVLVDISSPNPNVYYELGLCDAVGKDFRLLKQVGTPVPADLAGAHYIEYDKEDLAAAKKSLTKELKTWRKNNDISSITRESRSPRH